MPGETILTRHPQGKSGRTMSKQNYEIIREAMITILQDQELTHTELFNLMNYHLKGTFAGNISWYAETVKLDLEARGIIERTDKKPQTYQLKIR